MDIRVNLNKRLRTLENKVSTVCIWDYREQFLGYGNDNQISEMNPFVERVQFMTATGGNEGRDLFRNPLDRTVMDDYAFEPLLTACENALRLGVKPFIKTGSIPLKFSANPEIGKFGVNLHIPENMEDYYCYLSAVCTALVEHFGMDEVRSWWWGVFTEMENKEWFQASPDPDIAAKCNSDIYDYSVCAITDVLGDSVKIGAHLMMTVTLSEKLNMFPPEAFVRHCGTEKNIKNGKPVHLDYLAYSFYDNAPRIICPETFASVGMKLRGLAERYGIKNVLIGCDEGRINSGNDCKELSPRTVGFRYQAAMDADLIWQMVNFDIGWFSAWSYRSGGLMDGLKSVGFHVAENYYSMVGLTQVETETHPERFLKIKADAERINSLAGVDQNGNVTVMVYHFQPGEDCCEREIPIKISFPTTKKSKRSKVVCRFIDDRCNFFPHWVADRDAQGLETPGRWSQDSPEVMTPGFDAEKYERYSHLIPEIEDTEVQDGVETLCVNLKANSVLFINFTATDED